MRTDICPIEQAGKTGGWATRQLDRVVSALIARQASRLSQRMPAARELPASH